MREWEYLPKCWSVLNDEDEIIGYVSESVLVNSPPYILLNTCSPVDIPLFTISFISRLPDNCERITSRAMRSSIASKLINDIIEASAAYGFYPDSLGDPERIFTV